MGSTPCVQLKCGWTNTSDCFTCTEETSWYDYLKEKEHFGVVGKWKDEQISSSCFNLLSKIALSKFCFPR